MPPKADICGFSNFRSTPAVVDAFDKLKGDIATLLLSVPLNYSSSIINRHFASIMGVGGGNWKRLPDGTVPAARAHGKQRC